MSRYFLFLALLLGMTAAARADDVAFIVNPQGADASLSADDLKAVLLGNKTKWDGGGLIKLAVLTAGPAHDSVMQTYAQRSADQFEKYWKKLVFTGKGFMPMQAADEAAMIEYVAKTPGALGYVSASAVTDRVKVLSIK
ncbi:substrate-binding domain-containing protein [Rariglobus hedericola]|uniref:Phosphate ABC transporter substrate-binding protein n=1 Tax=Rariglobus hedericola TaxID=2597822 RepID=A0A556QPN9_9BACT|nr:substrate-binding domain-containing protein [Rariglobus hedericola]TSJ78601.1 phosphate ABC transporter substrate-binding protein [Rariglobus hedericola]